MVTKPNNETNFEEVDKLLCDSGAILDLKALAAALNIDTSKLPNADPQAKPSQKTSHSR